MWCNGISLAWNARDVGSSPALGIIFPIFIAPSYGRQSLTSLFTCKTTFQFNMTLDLTWMLHVAQQTTN